MYKTISLLTILSLTLTSCCSMVCDRTKQVIVTAQQSDAEVFIDGYACGKAPFLVDLDKTYDHTIVVSKPGYQPQQAFLKSHHTKKWASNLIAPIAGAAIGTGIGYLGSLIAYGTLGAYVIPPFAIIGATVGATTGLGLGLVGIAADIHLRSDCELDAQSVHFNLIQTNPS